MRKLVLLTSVLATVALASCSRTDYDAADDLGARPQPLEAQPVSPVESGQLPDPTTDTTQFPEKPATDPNAALNSGQPNPQMEASALEVRKEAMVGGWKVSQGGAGCDMFLTLTNLGSGSRGGTRGCVGDLQTMASWEVQGKQVIFKDRNGNVVARVYKTADNSFNGSTATGQPLGLSR